MNRTELTAVFDHPDQAQIRADLTAYFGPRPERFLAVYDRMRQAGAERWVRPLSWNAAVFFFSFVWFFYRKRYSLGVVTLLLSILMVGFGLSYAQQARVGFDGLVLGMVLSFFADTWYVRSAVRRIFEADDLELVGEQRQNYLRLAGGVSKTAGSLAVIGFVIVFLLAGLSLFGEMLCACGEIGSIHTG